MFSVLFRGRSTAACGALQRCWTPALAGLPGGVSAWSGFVGLRSTDGEPGGARPPPACVTRSSELPGRLRPRDCSFPVRSQRLHSSAARLKKRARPEPPPRELDLLRYDMKHLWRSPRPALYLGFAGLIPFVTPTLFMAVTESYCPQLAHAQVAYAAAIVSFLGGARWGFALPESSPAKPDWVNLSNSVVPPLLAWAAMLLSDSVVPAATMVIMGLGISLHYDLALLPTYPSWFKALRAALTAVAFFSLLGTLVMNGLYPEKSFPSFF